MFAPKTLITVVAVMAGVASAAPAPSPSTTFTLSSVNITQGAGCALLIDTEFKGGCQGVAVLDGGENCEDIKTLKSGPACNGSASVDFTQSPPKAQFIAWEYLAYCDLKDDKCVNKY
ncbi:uncharacterized protein TRUGW13939_09023 [Talaromyces rugulosus]|uniref:Uncharacterized protein n=1 Tax=Talaromyces rugulosus TaxID=121627 RepID=A0A7H8R6M3_TALRU|nr:uncharacterized protein TRUGW13939_09023 [Talaromyces rugulosus]QKX61867.1 hypothetical protein TRUGW13939_09023 [Talaromyces rugulosus]